MKDFWHSGQEKLDCEDVGEEEEEVLVVLPETGTRGNALEPPLEAEVDCSVRSRLEIVVGGEGYEGG